MTCVPASILNGTCSPPGQRGVCRTRSSGQLPSVRVIHSGTRRRTPFQGATPARQALALSPALNGPLVHASTVAMGLKAVESFDTSFELNPEAKEVLEFLLSSDTFLEQVASQPGLPEGSTVTFTGELFQPVPWSPATKHGMPQEYEKFFHDKENYAIINVPPNFMFKAQIFKPSRLCAIYQIHKDAEEPALTTESAAEQRAA